MVLRHKCDNARCINPEHLDIGTQHDNILDKVARNRQPVGSKNILSKLTENDVLQIRQSNASKFDLASKFAVTERTIRDIRAYRGWKHI